MRVRISHETVHRFSPPVRMLIQNLRMTPYSFDSQYVLSWRIDLDIDIDGTLKKSVDAHGNLVSTFSHHGAPIEQLTVTASGEIETTDSAGVVRGTGEPLPAEMYLRETPLTHINGGLRGFAKESAVGAEGPLDAMHRLMAELHRVMTFDPFQTDDPDSAAEAFALRRGRARDFAHIFVACARSLNVPARFVNGYCVAEEAGGEPGAHCWAEAHVPTLGWVAFDPTACICADPRYVRIAVGFDAHDGDFFRSAHGMGQDAIESLIRVEQAGFQTQA